MIAIIDYDAELASYREDKYSKLPNDNLKRKTVDWDSFCYTKRKRTACR